MDFSPIIEHPKLRKLYLRWMNVAPEKKIVDFYPEDFIEFLPHIFLMDYDKDTGRFRYRLIGTFIQDRIGRNITGMYLDDVRSGDAFENLHELFSGCVREKKVGYYVSRLSTETDALATYFRLAMPLKDRAGDITRILGGWYCEYNDKANGTVMEFESSGARLDRLNMVFHH